MNRFVIIIKTAKAPSLVLALALQLFPISRVFIAATPGAATCSFAIVSTWVAVSPRCWAATIRCRAVPLRSPARRPRWAQTALPSPIASQPDPTVRISTMPSLYPAASILSTTSGRITGTPLEDGVFTVLLTASDREGAQTHGDPGPHPHDFTARRTDAADYPDGSIESNGTNGGAARFIVTASGSGPLRYTWRLNGTPLAGATNSILALTGVSTNQAGEYSVVVTNGFGSATSASATLTVVVRPFIATQPVAQTVVAEPKPHSPWPREGRRR